MELIREEDPSLVKRVKLLTRKLALVATRMSHGKADQRAELQVAKIIVPATLIIVPNGAKEVFD